MNYIATEVKDGVDFTLTPQGVLWLQGEGTVNVDQVTKGVMRRVNGFFQPTGEKVTPLTVLADQEGEVHLPTGIPLRTTRTGLQSIYCIEPDPCYSPRPKRPFTAVYEVHGTGTLTFDDDKTIGPFHVPGIRGGRLALCITSIVESPGLGRLYLETSKDGETWHALRNSGFVDGEMLVHQDIVQTGDFVEDDFYLINHGEYLRLRFDASDIIAWGFTADMLIEVNK